MPVIGALGTTAAVPVPTIMNDIQADDLLVAIVFVCWSANFDTSSPIAPPPGWTEVIQDDLAYSDPEMGDRLAIFTRVSTGVEPADYEFTWDETASYVGRMLMFRGVDPADPVIVAAGMVTSADNDPITVDAPAIVTAVANQRMLCVYAARGNVAWTMPASLENLSQTDSEFAQAGVAADQAGGGTGTGIMNIAQEVIETAGDTGTRQATIAPALGPPDGIGLGFTLALNPST